MTTFDPIYELFLNTPEELTLEELQEFDTEWPPTAPFLFQDFIVEREDNRHRYRR